MPTTALALPPPLREGDQLTAEEFLRRWDAMPDLNRAELIDGIVYMSSPLSDPHANHDHRMNAWLGFYTVFTPGCYASANVTWVISPKSVPQPDVLLRIERGAKLFQGKYPTEAPELIVEVSHTTFARDSGLKLRLYERSGVQEYLIMRTDKRQCIWNELVDGKYRSIEADSDGLLRSRVFPGLWLDPEKVWNYDPAGLLAVIQRGAATEEHLAFVTKLASSRADL